MNLNDSSMITEYTMIKQIGISMDYWMVSILPHLRHANSINVSF